MNLLLTESHFLLPRGADCFLMEVALILCDIDSRRDCGKGLCCEASLRGKLGGYLKQQEKTTVKKKEDKNMILISR